MKEAMKAREKERLATIRLIQAEFKRVEVDDKSLLGINIRMISQHCLNVFYDLSDFLSIIVANADGLFDSSVEHS